MLSPPQPPIEHKALLTKGVRNLSLAGMHRSSYRKICRGQNNFPHRRRFLLVLFLPRVFATGSQIQVPPETRHCLPWEGHELVEIGQSYFLMVGSGTRLCTSAQLERAPELLFIRYAAVYDKSWVSHFYTFSFPRKSYQKSY